MKKNFTVAALALASVLAVGSASTPVFAQDGGSNGVKGAKERAEIRTQNSQGRIDKINEKAEDRVQNLEQKMENAQTRNENNAKKRTELRKENALKEIDRRVVALKNLISKINKFKRINDEQKTSLIKQVQSEIDSLSSLRATIEAETDSTKLIEEKKSIVDSYRIFALFIPEMTIVAHGDQILETANLMLAKTTNTEASAKINEAKTKAQNAITSVLALTPAGYPGNKSVLDSARTLLKEAIKDLNTARPLINK